MKYIKIVFILLFTFTSTAAIHSKIRLGVKGGINVANARFNNAFESENITGFNIGPVVEAMFGEGGLGLDMALLYTQKGFEADDESYKNSYIQVPVNLKFKFGIPLLNPFIAVGPYADFRVDGEKIWDVKINSDGIREQIKSRNFGAGLNFSAGVEILRFLQAGVNYNWGLTDNYKSFDKSKISSYKGRLHTWSATAIIFF
jgi:hypothetical protein